jgi:hypothetical protein
MERNEEKQTGKTGHRDSPYFGALTKDFHKHGNVPAG